MQSAELAIGPDERRQQVSRRLPQAEPPVSAITNLYSNERYGRRTRSPAEADAQSDMADEAWGETRASILRRYLRRFLPWLRN